MPRKKAGRGRQFQTRVSNRGPTPSSRSTPGEAKVSFLQRLSLLSDNYGSKYGSESYCVNLNTGDIKYFPSKKQAPTEVEVVVAQKSKGCASRQLDREFDTNFLSSQEEHLVRKRL